MAEQRSRREPGESEEEKGTDKPAVLIVDDEESMRQFLAIALRREGMAPLAAASAAEASRLLEGRHFDMVLLDMRLGDEDGLVLLRAIIERDPSSVVVIITGHASIETAVEAMRLGAYDYVVKPVELDPLLATIRRALQHRQHVTENRELLADLARAYRFEGVIGHSPRMREAFRIAALAAPTDATVVIHGETGTGKELVARSIHLQSRRAHGPLVTMNCGAIPETLLETEIFGHEKGAFTGAAGARPGRFERAEGGTLFLDEIGDMTPGMQVKFLRVLEEGVVERVGGVKPIKVDCRIVCATNKDLYQMMKRGEYREDLYYRLSVVRLEIPPLRDRTEDLPPLVEYFIEKFRRQLGKPIRGIAPPALKKLRRHPWPGNIRELEHCIKRAFILAEGAVITPDHIVLETDRHEVAAGR